MSKELHPSDIAKDSVKEAAGTGKKIVDAGLRALREFVSKPRRRVIVPKVPPGPGTPKIS
jgi:hypothetical protein